VTLKVPGLPRTRRARAASQPDPLVRQAALVPPSVRGAAMRLACAVSEAERLAGAPGRPRRRSR
jgi:hypothetical protein